MKKSTRPCPPHSTAARRRRRPVPVAGLTLKALPLAVALCFCPALQAQVINPNVDGLPQRGRVLSGDVSGALDGSTKLTLTQTGQRAVIDWKSFNIDQGKTVQFVQPNASAAVLNLVSANAGMSEIYGTMSANGMVLLMNPNGVLFHQGATINVASLIVTTGTINQPAFEAGSAFQITGATSGSITNQGSITAANAGLVALVAPSVTNHGVITATNGRIALSGADRATVSLNNGLYEFAVDSGALGTNASITNAAGASLNGATILMSTGDAANLVSGVINLQGVQQASSAIVVNGSTVVLKSDLDAPSISGSSNTVQVHDTASVQDAVKIAKTGSPGAGATVELQAGTFNEQVTLNKANLTLTGQAGAKLVVPDVAEVNGIAISANNVTVQGMEIAGPINSPYYDYYATSRSNISRGIAVGDGITGFTIQNNNIHDVRNGILIHGRNSTGTVSNNRIENTKSGISVQYTDATGIGIAGNSEGSIGNEWGLNLHLNGHVDGSGTILSNSTPIAAAPTSSWQQSLLNLSTANNGWAVQDQGYTASNRTRVTVATTGAANNQGSRLTPINTIQGGVNAVVAGGKVNVNAGTYAESVSITKALTLDGAGAGQSIIDPVSSNAVTVSGNIGAGSTVLIDGFTFRDAPSAGVSVEGDTVLGQLTVQNSEFRSNGAYGFTANGSATAGIPGLAKVSLLDSTFAGNGAVYTSATSLGQGDIHFNYYNGDATLRNLTITGSTEHTGIHFRGYHNASTGAVYDAGTWVFDNVTLDGSFRRPSGSAGTWNPSGPGHAIHLFEYGSVANVSFNDVKLNQTVGHGLFLEGLSSTLNIGNTAFGVPDSTVTGTGTNPTRSMNIVSGSNSQNNVKTNVDATHATFTGATSGFDIEDRVGHALDATGLGLVTWNAGNLYVTQTSGSVQRGIDAAAVGNTVNVAAGTYGGFRVNVAGLTVLGDRGNLTAAGPGLHAPVINTCYQGIVCSGVLIDAENVTLSGFDISNNSGPYGVQIGEINGARANGVTLSYNRIHGVNGVNSGDGIRAVEVEPANNVTIKYNLIEDISPTNAAAASAGKSVAGIFVRSAGGAFSNIAIEDNVIRDIDQLTATGINGVKGIWVGGSAGSANVAGLTIRRNQISGVQSNLGAEGILVNHGKNSTGATSGLVISGNAISDVVGASSSHGIELSGATPNALVTQNDIDLASSNAADTAGVYFDSNANANPSAATVAVSGNRLTGTGYGVAVAGGATINASGNWWGTTSESGVLAKTSGSVDISPFLMSGTDTDLGTAGFQGSTSNLTVTALGAQTGSAGRIQEGIDLVNAGGTVNVGAGTHAQASTLYVNKSLTLSGAGEAATTIDARSVTSATGSYGMSVNASDVTLRDFTFYGPSTYYASAYGIKVSPGGSADARLRNFTIRNVTSRGAGKAELDLNGVDGALIDGVTLNGAPVGNEAGTTQGAGLQLTDSANVTVRNTTTLNNAWGGLALYQANRSYNQQVNNITIEDSNHFNEANPVYLQDESASKDFGALSIAGFDYAVRNASNADSSQYTWLQASKQKAYDYAVNLSGVDSSYIQGWNGAGTTQNFEVGVGNLARGGTQAMSIATALSRSATGAGISIGAGTYDESVTLASRRDLRFAGATLQSLRLNGGADNSGIGGQVTVTGGAGITLNADVNLLADSTLATTGGNINLNGRVQNAGSTAYGLTLTAGTGGNRGNVSLASGGAQNNPLGVLQVNADRFTLSDTLWVQRYQINALGNVALSDSTLRATATGVTSTLSAGGNVSGSTISRGSVVFNSDGNVAANVTADGDATVTADNISGIMTGANVSATAGGTVNVVATAANAASLRGNSIKGSVSAISARLEADSRVDVAMATTTADVRAGDRADISGRSARMTISAPHGQLSGNFDQVDVIGNGSVDINGKPKVNQEVEKKLENIPVIPVIVLPVPIPMPVVLPPPAPVVVPAPAPAVAPLPAPAPTPAAAPAPAPSAPAAAPGTPAGGEGGASAGAGTSSGGGGGAASAPSAGGGNGSNGAGGSGSGAGSSSSSSGGTSSSSTSSGSGEGGASSTSGGGESGSSSGSGTSGGGGGGSGTSSGGNRGAGRPAGTVTAGTRLAPTSRSAPGKAGTAIDKGQAVEIDLSPGQ